MAEIIAVPTSDLLVDPENPRIPDQNDGQREALRAIVRDDPDKILTLAEDIVAYRGLDPTALLTVTASAEQPGRYIALEGNRRVATLKGLESPSWLEDVVEPRILNRMRQLSGEYQSFPVRVVQCVVLNRADAQHWIDLRHTGENRGAGTVQWSPDQKARFRVRSRGESKLHTRLLDFLQDRGHISAAERQRVPTSTLERILTSPAVRNRIGIDLHKGGDVHFRDEDTAIKALLYIINDLTVGFSGEPTKVHHVYTKEQRVAYAANLPADLVPKTPSPVNVPTSTPIQTGSPVGKRSPLARVPKPRPILIPTECRLRVKDSRVRAIEIELRKLELEDFPNSVSLLFRVFIELSVDWYRANVLKRKPEAVKDYLKDKLLDVLTGMETKNLLTKYQANPIRLACQKGTFLMPSVVMMHEYIHNRHMNPTPTDLRLGWDNFQPFIEAIWPY